MSKKIILFILLIGIFYRLSITSGGNFLFNMDNARDFIDVREMVELKKIRLIGPNSAIEGFYNGPFWYYLLAITYILTKGDPYGAIIMLVGFWAIGGYYLMKLVRNFGILPMIVIGFAWVASNYIVLANVYSFNPNPVTLLTPLFLYGLWEYIKGKKFWILLVWFLAGAFFNFEMNFGIFLPFIILAGLILTNHTKLLKERFFWLGFALFITALLPQLLFDLRHQFVMSKSIFKFLSQHQGGSFNLFDRIQAIGGSFLNTFYATIMNQKVLAIGLLLLCLPILKRFISNPEKNIIVTTTLVYILIPFLGYLIIPVNVNPWHLGGVMAASLILAGYIISEVWRINFWGKIISTILFLTLMVLSISNILNFFTKDRFAPSLDPSSFRNEVAAIDYIYKYAKGENFKVYTYLPSVYDYPYQYLIWWHGRKNYGYIPGEYVYSPNKPTYIPGQSNFQGRKDNLSGLVFLIKEPDRIKMRQAWENDFKNMEFISKEMVGPIEVEIRKEKTI